MYETQMNFMLILESWNFPRRNKHPSSFSQEIMPVNNAV
jgi:hypothetical protein